MTDTNALPTHKREKLVRETAALARAYVAVGKTVEEAVAHVASTHEALSKALDPKGPFTHLLAVEIEKEWNKRLPNYPVPHAEAMRAAENILTNRVAEEHAYVALLKTTDFTTNEVKAAVANHAVSHGGAALPEGKIKEIAGRLVQESDPNGPEGATHVIAGAVGQRIMHEALAASYAPNGPLTEALIGQLKPHLPDATPEALLSIANGWLHDRYHPAKAVAEAMHFDGEAYKMAIARADEIQKSTPTQEPAKAASFVERVTAKPDTTGKDLLIDRI